jgi:hypothetical protein
MTSPSPGDRESSTDRLTPAVAALTLTRGGDAYFFSFSRGLMPTCLNRFFR